MAQKMVSEPGIQLGAQQLATLLDSTREFIAILGVDGTVQFANSTTKSLLGYRTDELLGRSLHAIVHALDVEKIRDVLKQILENPSAPLADRCRLRCKDGSFRWFDINFRNRTEERGLEVQYEAGKKHDGTFTAAIVEELVAEGQRWLDAGAKSIVIEGRESALDVGLFDDKGKVNAKFAERFVEAFTMDRVVFEAPNKQSQFALMNHFGNMVQISNVRLEELLRVEIYRRGLHSDAFEHDNLRPAGPARVGQQVGR